MVLGIATRCRLSRQEPALMTDVETTRAPQPPTESRRRRLPRGFPVFAIVGLAIVAFFVGGVGGGYQSKLADVQKRLLQSDRQD